MLVLVPFDGSESALRAVRYAASIAHGNPVARLELLHVLDPARCRRTAGTPASAKSERLAAQEFERVIAPARTILDAGDVAYRVVRRNGDPAGEIAAQVRESGCDGVIMGTRGMDQLADTMVGSVALRTAYLVDVPVTLVK